MSDAINGALQQQLMRDADAEAEITLSDRSTQHEIGVDKAARCAAFFSRGAYLSLSTRAQTRVVQQHYRSNYACLVVVNHLLTIYRSQQID